MSEFDQYKINFDNSTNYPGQYVAYIEELHGVICLLEDKDQASEKLRPLFCKEIKRLEENDIPVPQPGSGKARISFVSNTEIEKLRPFIEEFWDKILGISYTSSFVSDKSQFDAWEHYLDNGKDKLIKKVKQI